MRKKRNLKKQENSESQKDEMRYVPVKDSRKYLSGDLGSSGYLLCQEGYELEDLERREGNKVIFVIKCGPNLKENLRNYWNSKAPVDAQTYFNQLKRIKNQINNFK